MRYFILVILFTFTSLLTAQEKDSTKVTEESQSTTTKSEYSPSKWYYGGNIGFSFWADYFYISVSPLVGYKVTPQFSVGAKVGYSYSSDSSVDPTLTSSNYGASIFTRYRIIPQFYLHGEFVYASYESYTITNLLGDYTTSREWVPFLLLGGGFSQMIGSNVWAYVEVLFDVLQDENSPYEDWDPIVSFGVGVGF